MARFSKGVEIKDFLLKAEQRLPIYKLLSKKYNGDTTQINRLTSKKRNDERIYLERR
jgi:penicillin-binding protein 1A